MSWDIAGLHASAVAIVNRDRELISRGMGGNIRLSKEIGILNAKLRVSELELKGERQRADRLEEELEMAKKEIEEVKKNKKVSADMNEKNEWDKIERKVVECVRKVMREEMRSDRNKSGVG